jgi:hypothetical protein
LAGKVLTIVLAVLAFVVFVACVAAGWLVVAFVALCAFAVCCTIGGVFYWREGFASAMPRKHVEHMSRGSEEALAASERPNPAMAYHVDANMTSEDAWSGLLEAAFPSGVYQYSSLSDLYAAARKVGYVVYPMETHEVPELALQLAAAEIASRIRDASGVAAYEVTRVRAKLAFAEH